MNCTEQNSGIVPLSAYITRQGYDLPLDEFDNIPLGPETPDNSCRRELWLQLHLLSGQDPHLQAVDVYNAQNQWLGTFISAAELSRLTGLPLEEIELGLKQTGTVGCYYVRYTVNGDVLTTAVAESAGMDGSNATLTAMPLTRQKYIDSLVNKFVMDETPILKQGVKHRLARLARGECPVHGVPMLRGVDSELGNVWYTPVSCCELGCAISGIGRRPSEPISLLPEFAYLLAS